MEALQLPVTLVVKAPNQKIQDQTVQCGWEWTVRKVKEHLSDVYPSKPEKTQQKLIYSGKLLQDHQTLKDVLRQYDRNQTIHTVHLVCSHMALDMPPAESKSSKVPSTGGSQQQQQQQQQGEMEGVRRRGQHQPTGDPMPTQVPSQTVPMPQLDPSAMQHMFSANAMMYGNYYPGMMAMTPEQMAWLQHMYSQQMNYFLQMYQGSVAPTSPADQEGEAQPAGNRAPPAEAAQQEQPMRMNAQGGLAVDDEDGEERHRDWLDYLYTFSRFSVLLSIVYFYSTISRFVLVLTFFLFFYLYQGGWFKLQRNLGQQRQQQPQQQQQQQQENDPPEPAVDQNEDREMESSEEEETQGGSTEPPAPAPPSGVQVAWTFVSSFFLSLMPQQPPVVNAN